MNVNRRTFLGAATAALASATGPSLAELLAAEPDKAANVEKLVSDLFESADPAVIKLAADVYRQCILGKVMPPEGTLAHRWLAPGGIYKGQWIWDTMFVADLLAIVPGQTPLLREVFENYWDFQQRWNKVMPAYAHDMVACMIEPHKADWIKYPAYSQIPILAWGVERVFQRTGDRELLRQSVGPIERFHQWYWRERDVTDVGLVAVGAYSGVVQHARFETFDFECNLDDLHMTPHPRRRGEKEGPWYGDVLAAGNTAYLLHDEQCLARLAETLGETAIAARCKARAEKGIEAMRKHMWDEKAGTFLSVRRDSLEKIPVATIGSWMALEAGVPTQAQADRMAEAFRGPSWQTPLPVPTVDRLDPRWKSGAMWRGDVWPATNYQVATGLARYGHKDLAAEIADKTVANVLAHGISERYDSVSGKSLGVAWLGMTCTILTMMLDGLSTKYHLRIKK